MHPRSYILWYSRQTHTHTVDCVSQVRQTLSFPVTEQSSFPTILTAIIYRSHIKIPSGIREGEGVEVSEIYSNVSIPFGFEYWSCEWDTGLAILMGFIDCHWLKSRLFRNEKTENVSKRLKINQKFPSSWFYLVLFLKYDYTGRFLIKTEDPRTDKQLQSEVLSAVFIRMHRCGLLSACSTWGNTQGTLCVSSVISALILNHPCILITDAKSVIILIFFFWRGLDVSCKSYYTQTQ